MSEERSGLSWANYSMDQIVEMSLDEPRLCPVLALRSSLTLPEYGAVEGDGGAVNLESWSGMPLVSGHASSSSYVRPL